MTFLRGRAARTLAPLALLVSLAYLAAPTPAAAFAGHPTLELHAVAVRFYAGHLVLDAEGAAALVDGPLRVDADRIILDLRAKRYVAAGNVTVAERDGRTGHGAAFGMDLTSKAGLLVSAESSEPWGEVAPAQTEPSAAPAPTAAEPLGLPDLGGEEPFAIAAGATVHVGADVRLRSARVNAGAPRAVYLPSYVYTYSSDTGYVVNNVPGANEDLPIYFYSTPTSIEGLHFLYNPTTKVGIGLDAHLVYGPRAYALISLAPLNGPNHTLNFTWQQQINAHTTQTFASSSATGVGTQNLYDVRDSVHRSFFELLGSQYHSQNALDLAWQGFDQPLATAGFGSKLYFHLRTDYGYQHTPALTPGPPFSPTDVLPATIFHTGLEGYAATQPLGLGRNATLTFSADGRRVVDTSPHDQTAQTYTAGMTLRWNRFLTTNIYDSETPVHDEFPSVGAAFSTHVSTQTFNAFYSHANAFSLVFSAVHATAQTTNPSPSIVAPWIASADVRFRLNPRLSLELSRSYFFGFEGQRFGSLGVQILP